MNCHELNAITPIAQALSQVFGVNVGCATIAARERMFTLHRNDINYWAGDSLQPLLDAVREQEVELVGLDAEWLGVASAGRPRSGVNAQGRPLCDGRVAVLQFATLEPLLGKHVQVISLSAYDTEPVQSFPPELVRGCGLSPFAPLRLEPLPAHIRTRIKHTRNRVGGAIHGGEHLLRWP